MRVFLLLVVTISALVFVPAADATKPASIPERSGDYADPEHPGIRVRVFVREPNSARAPQPTPTPSPVLSCTDEPNGPLVSSTGWQLPASNWVYRVNPSSSLPALISQTNWNKIVDNSFAEWNQGLGSSTTKPTFVKGSNTSVNRSSYDGQNIIAWGRTSGSALGVTYTRYYSSTGEVVDVDTIMNQKFAWSWTDPTLGVCSQNASTYDAQSILTHELGHWLGLDDEYDSTHEDNTMFGYGAKGEIEKGTLTTGDIQGLQGIYP